MVRTVWDVLWVLKMRNRNYLKLILKIFSVLVHRAGFQTYIWIWWWKARRVSVIGKWYRKLASNEAARHSTRNLVRGARSCSGLTQTPSWARGHNPAPASAALLPLHRLALPPPHPRFSFLSPFHENRLVSHLRAFSNAVPSAQNAYMPSLMMDKLIVAQFNPRFLKESLAPLPRLKFLCFESSLCPPLWQLSSQMQLNHWFCRQLVSDYWINQPLLCLSSYTFCVLRKGDSCWILQAVWEAVAAQCLFKSRASGDRSPEFGQVLAPTLCSRVTLGMLHNLSELSSLVWKVGAKHFIEDEVS